MAFQAFKFVKLLAADILGVLLNNTCLWQIPSMCRELHKQRAEEIKTLQNTLSYVFFFMNSWAHFLKFPSWPSSWDRKLTTWTKTLKWSKMVEWWLEAKNISNWHKSWRVKLQSGTGMIRFYVFLFHTFCANKTELQVTYSLR